MANVLYLPINTVCVAKPLQSMSAGMVPRTTYISTLSIRNLDARLPDGTCCLCSRNDDCDLMHEFLRSLNVVSKEFC
jgi:hypothetical protein